jgi:pimeloyl-ACP methyl ester carboxylesterase
VAILAATRPELPKRSPQVYKPPLRGAALIILHGGPGDTTSQLAYFFRHWERVLTVVQWDQRGAGRTYGAYGKATPGMTLDRMIEDGAEVARYASQHTGQHKIILLGDRSWAFTS